MPASSTARTHWEGTTVGGAGHVSTDSPALDRREVTWKARTGETPGTTPEELMAAAWSSCYAMAFAGALARAGHDPETLDVEATLTFGPQKSGGFAIEGGSISVAAAVPGIAEEEFQRIAADAKLTCPVSVALGELAQRAQLSARLEQPQHA